MFPQLYNVTSQIVGLSRSGRITCARKLFDQLPFRDSVVWNAMLTGYSQLGLHQQLVSLFRCMRFSDSKPDHFSFSATLNSCANASDLPLGIKLHALVLILGYQSSMAVSNSLIDMYGKCFHYLSARKVFDDMNARNEVTWCSLLFAYVNSCQFSAAHGVFGSMPKRVEIGWNIMIAGHARNGQVEACLHLFKEMLGNSCKPDQWTFSALVNACAESLEIIYGWMVHCLVVKAGWSTAVEVKNSILSFYAKLGHGDDAFKVFDSDGTSNQVSWNTIIDAHMKLGDPQKALFTFQEAPDRNIVSWTSMIVGYTRNGNGEQALNVYVNMIRNCMRPDDFAVGTVLDACSCLALLGHGKMMHNCIIHFGFHTYVYVGNGLVNMYAKCGDIESSGRAFNDIIHKDLVSWNTMLFALGLHGRAREAFCLYGKMVACGIIPDKVTFIGLLITCSHMGLINKGRTFFESMNSIYQLSPEIDHVACVVDMLGRSGDVAEARKLAYSYSGTSSARKNSMEVLLGSCHAHGDYGIGTCLGTDLKDLEPKKEISYVLLSNLCCASGQWKEAERIRKAMLDNGVKKMPGSSWIEVRNEVTAFVSGSISHPYIDDLRKTLNFLELHLRQVSRVAIGPEN